MKHFPQFKRRIRSVLTHCSSLLFLLQRAPVIQALLPEARVLGAGATGQIVKWTAAAVAGLACYDTVAGATLHNPPTISRDPSSVTINSGGTATLNVFVTGSGTISFQWFQSVGSAPFGLIHGATRASYTTLKLTTTTKYLVRVSNSSGSVVSNTATVRVIAPPRLIKSPSPVTIINGATALLTVKASGTALKYQWFSGASGDISHRIANANSASYRTPPLAVSSKFWVQVKNTAGSVDSKTAVVTVGTLPTRPFSIKF